MNIRYADMSDLAAVTAVEAACFPPAEAATQQDFAQRLRYYSGHFWLMFDGGTLIAFVDAGRKIQRELQKKFCGEIRQILKSGGAKAVEAGRKLCYTVRCGRQV